MKVKNVKTNMFYPTMKAWWEGHNFPVLDRNFLPEEVFVCYNGHVAIYSICFYHTDSGLIFTYHIFRIYPKIKLFCSQ